MLDLLLERVSDDNCLVRRFLDIDASNEIECQAFVRELEQIYILTKQDYENIDNVIIERLQAKRRGINIGLHPQLFCETNNWIIAVHVAWKLYLKSTDARRIHPAPKLYASVVNNESLSYVAWLELQRATKTKLVDSVKLFMALTAELLHEYEDRLRTCHAAMEHNCGFVLVPNDDESDESLMIEDIAD